MTYRHTPTEIGLAAILFTEHSRVFGEVRANYYSLADALAVSDESYVIVTNAGVRPLIRGVTEELQSASVLLRKEHIVIGVPVDAHDLEVSLAFLANQGERYEQRAVVKAGPLILDGVFFVTRGAKVLDLLLHHPSFYLPMADVAVSHEEEAFTRFTSPYVMLNRQWIDTVLDDPQVTVVGGPQSVADGSVPVALEPSVEELGLVPEALDEVGAAEILLATDVFRDADLGVLQGVMSDLVANEGIARQSIAAGGTVVRQGEPGDTLYVVERGTLEVFIDKPLERTQRSVAALGPGAVFGEMAVLGDGRRTATVRATADATLLVLSAESWKVLAAHLPGATTNLLRIMAPRRGARGGLLRRLQ